MTYLKFVVQVRRPGLRPRRACQPSQRRLALGPGRRLPRSRARCSTSRPPGGSASFEGVEKAERLRLLELRELESLVSRCHGHRGLGALLPLLREWTPQPTRSILESDFLELCRTWGLPLPITNATAAGPEVDALWPEQRLVVELDGYAFHRGRGAFEGDRRRDARLQAAGHRVIRLTHGRITTEAAAVVAELGALLGVPAR